MSMTRSSSSLHTNERNNFICWRFPQYISPGHVVLFVPHRVLYLDEISLLTGREIAESSSRSQLEMRLY